MQFHITVLLFYGVDWPAQEGKENESKGERGSKTVKSDR
jgi:hypothetical protein